MNGKNTRWTGGSVQANTRTHSRYVYANLTIDVAADTGNFFTIDEGETGQAGFSVETKGVNPAQNATATIELAPPFRLLILSLQNDGPPGWTLRSALRHSADAAPGRSTGGDPVKTSVSPWRGTRSCPIRPSMGKPRSPWLPPATAIRPTTSAGSDAAGAALHRHRRERS